MLVSMERYLEEEDEEEDTPDQVTKRSFGPDAAASTIPGVPGVPLCTIEPGVVEEGAPHPTIWFLANMRTKYWLPGSRPVISYSPP